MIGQVLDGRYRVVRNLGEGGFSKTFLAEDSRRPGSPICVVKHLQPARTDADFLDVARRLFHSEAEALEKLGHYDQIPRLLAFFEENQEFYLIQEFVPGSSLAEALASGQPWPEAKVRVLLKELLETLSFIHRLGVIHRDIKPENIICRQSDQKYILVDFGSVKQVSSQTLLHNDQMTGTVIVGTPGYMAGEQGQGKPRPCSDIYALGVVAIQALTGFHPSRLKEDDAGELIWQSQAHVSPQLATILTRMVRYYFKLRYQSADEVLQALGGRSEQATVVQSVDSRSPQNYPQQPPQRPPYNPTTARTRVVSQPRFEELSPKRKGSIWPAIATFSLIGILLGAGAVVLNPQLASQIIPFFDLITASDNGPELLATTQAAANTFGDLGKAIEALQDIPSTSAAYGEAQQQIQQWQGQWQDQQALFAQAEAAAQTSRWYQVRQRLSRLPQNPYWNQRSGSLSRQA
ncbi:MAG: serine/threonine-protein kinase, partial [Thermosynechococcaceae cyanobacterium]